MRKVKLAITLDRRLIRRLDWLVRQKMYPSRSCAIEHAIQVTLNRIERSRRARECAKLDPEFEKAMAEEGLTEDFKTWPEY